MKSKDIPILMKPIKPNKMVINYIDIDLIDPGEELVSIKAIMNYCDQNKISYEEIFINDDPIRRRVNENFEQEMEIYAKQLKKYELERKKYEQDEKERQIKRVKDELRRLVND